MSDEHRIKQYEFWSKESKKYLNLYVQKSVLEKLPQSELDVYRYAMWYCQEQTRKCY